MRNQNTQTVVKVKGLKPADVEVLFHYHCAACKCSFYKTLGEARERPYFDCACGLHNEIASVVCKLEFKEGEVIEQVVQNHPCSPAISLTKPTRILPAKLIKINREETSRVIPALCRLGWRVNEAKAKVYAVQAEHPEMTDEDMVTFILQNRSR